jgi:hypothetical protein
VLLLADCYSKQELLHVAALCDCANVPYLVSGGALLDAWFISCLGAEYQFRNDPPNNKELRVLSFPTLAELTHTGAVPCSALVSRVHPAVSPVYLKARVLLDVSDGDAGRGSSAAGGAVAGESLVAEVQARCNRFAAAEGLSASVFTAAMVDEMVRVVSLRRSQSALEAQAGGVARRFMSNPVVVHSVVGSFLSQEVIKVLSLVGEPMFNIFVFSGATFEGKAFPARKAVVVGARETSTPAAKRQKVEEVEIFEL